jgi:hypothetical protein
MYLPCQVSMIDSGVPVMRMDGRAAVREEGKLEFAAKPAHAVFLSGLRSVNSRIKSISSGR